MTKAEVIAAIQAEIDAANQRATGREGHELANASWFVHGLEIALQIVEQLREDEAIAEDLQSERFEAWRTFQCDGGDNLIRNRHGDYSDRLTRVMWTAWQAALTWRASE